MKIEKFEDIKTWQEARVLANMVFNFIRESRMLRREYRFKAQLTSSSVSIMANIAEGFSRKSNKEFIQFLFIAKGSVSELQSHIYLASDQGFLLKEKFYEIYRQSDKVARLISSFISYLLNHKQLTL
ncbi:MAG: four helix bundle protein [Candidatus Omnitrophica bacterium]|nr:four helix bundle protein [Candidatus Omnitrophota bacterium]